MHVHYLDPYRDRSSPIHRLDPRVKLLLAVGFILATALTPAGAWPAYILLFALLLAVEILSDLGVGYVMRRSLLAFPFVLAAVPILFTLPGDPLLTLHIGPWSPTISVAGVERFISIALKSWLSVQMAIVLASSTQFPDLLSAMRAVRVPKLLVAVIGLMWRYLFVLADEAMRLMRARDARSGHPVETPYRTGGTLAWRARVTGGMAGNLFMRSFDRGERIYAAMAARGYDGEVRTLGMQPVPRSQMALLFVGAVVLALLVFLSYLL
jgi:cobalt/nickel transport system permease protein